VPAGLLDRQVAFVAALRTAGLPVSLAESLDATRAMAVLGLADRDALRSALAATLVKRPAQRLAFDTLFDLYYPRAVGDGQPAGEAPTDAPDDPGPPGADNERLRDRLRDRLRELLLDGDEAALRRLAREAVGQLGRAATQPGRQSFFAYRVLRRLSPDTLLAGLLEEVLRGQERGGLAERVARQTLAERLRLFETLVEAEVRRRLAEERGVEHVARTAVKPLAETVDFLRASRDDLQELRRQVYPLARRLGTRLTARRRHGHAGRLDFRRTVRASLSTGGVPVVTHHRPHKPHKPELVVLCDVSGSVASFAHFTMLLAYALREQFAKVRAFAFIDTTDEVTRFFTAGDDVAEAMARLVAGANLVWYDGHSDYGHAFEVFVEKWPDAVGPKTSLLILGDARNNYRALGLPALRSMVGRARHAYWLNPEPRQYWGSGDSSATGYAEVVEMVECRNAAQLEQFVSALL